MQDMLINDLPAFYDKKLPSQNILAEEILIGHLLSNTIIRLYVIHTLNLNFFTLYKHQILFFYIVNNPIDKNIPNIIQIINNLWIKQILNQVGGISNILHLIQKSKSTISYNSEYKDIDYIISLIRHHYLKRLLNQYSYNIFQINSLYNLSIENTCYLSIKYLNKIFTSSTFSQNTQTNHNISYILHYIQKSRLNRQNIISGFSDLDLKVNGFKAGELIIVAGRPSMGKTSFAINIAHNVIINSKLPVYIFSLEMSKQEIINKIIALNANIELNLIQNKTINTKNWLKIQQTCALLISSHLYIEDNGKASINYIKGKCENYTIKKNLIIIDYLQLIKTPENYTDNRSQEVGKITRELKLLAKNLKSPIILLSQLNRNIENRVNKRPLLSDLRESGCISHHNIPKLNHIDSIYYIETLSCIDKFYYIQKYLHLIFIENQPQQIYLLINHLNTIIYITHNHRILSNQAWNKEDQIQKNHYYNFKLQYNINTLLSIEFNILKRIKNFNKEYVYDIKLYEYYNFTINEHIIHNSIEQDADLILMLYKNNEEFDNRIIDIVIAKHRNGPTGSFQLFFHAQTCRFTNITNREFNYNYIN